MNNGPEVVHEGWLIKSPPSKRLVRARWRRRWFVLRQSGELPGQYFLCYYKDQTCKTLKGQIDLDECEQVDTGLQFENKYQHMFDVRTPKRVYYLAAETEDEMMKWVHNVCHVCGLKAYTSDEDAYNYSGTGEEEPSTPTTVITEQDLESPPISPTSTSSAYIPISECITGPPLTSTSGLTLPTAVYRASSQFHRLPPHLLPAKRPELITNNNISATSSGPSAAGAISDEFYDLPRQLRLPSAQGLDLISSDLRSGDGRSMQGEWDAQKSPGTDAESVFTDEEWTGPAGNLGVTSSGRPGHRRPVVNWETFPSSEGEQAGNVRPSDSSVDLDTSTETGTWNSSKRYSNRNIGVDTKPVLLSSSAPPPPRPPKPSHLLLDPPGHNYLNIENVSPASHTTNLIDKQKIENTSMSEPPSPLIATSTPLDGPSAVPGSAVVTDDMYDFPRSHQYADAHDSTRPPPMARHCYTNAAPGQMNSDGTVFRYDFQQDSQISSVVNAPGLQDDEPTSPRSESSSVTSATQYSNLPSPHILPPGGIPTPPAVDRGLKPRRKTSDSAASNEPSPSPLSQHSVGPPSVDRKLKPLCHPHDTSFLTLWPAPQGKRQDCSRSLRKTRTGPSPTPPQPPGSAPSTLRNGFRTRTEHHSSSDDEHRLSPDDDQFYKPYGSDHLFLSMGKEIKYLDLDLTEQDSKDTSTPITALTSAAGGVSIHPAPKSPEKGPPTTTVYKTVDFVKTEAFNRTRQEVEAEKKKKENA